MSGDHEGDDDAVSHLQLQLRHDIDNGIIIFRNKLKAHCRDKAGNNQQEQD